MARTCDAGAPPRSNSKRQDGSRRSVDTVGATPIQALGTRERDGRRDGERNISDTVTWRYRRHAEEAATFFTLAMVVVGEARMVLAGLRSRRVIVVRADAQRFRQAMHKRCIHRKGNCGNRCRQREHIQRGKRHARPPAPMPE